MECIWCGEKIVRMEGALFCSPQHKLKFAETDPTSSKSSYWQYALPEGKCIVCDRAFVRQGKRSKCCSPKCAKCHRKRTDAKRKGSRFTILGRDRFSCGYCGRSSAEDGVKLEVDHVVAERLGGESRASNLITACKECNAAKWMSPLDATTELRFLQEVARRNLTSNIDPATKILGNKVYKPS